MHNLIHFANNHITGHLNPNLPIENIPNIVRLKNVSCGFVKFYQKINLKLCKIWHFGNFPYVILFLQSRFYARLYFRAMEKCSKKIFEILSQIANFWPKTFQNGYSEHLWPLFSYAIPFPWKLF